MTIPEFQSLDSSLQFQVFKKGIEIGDYDDGYCIRKCRQVEDFYVEYIVETFEHFRMYMICHKDPKQLDKYFAAYPQLTVEELLD